MVECLPSVHQALDLIPSSAEIKDEFLVNHVHPKEREFGFLQPPLGSPLRTIYHLVLWSESERLSAHRDLEWACFQDPASQEHREGRFLTPGDGYTPGEWQMMNTPSPTRA